MANVVIYFLILFPTLLFSQKKGTITVKKNDSIYSSVEKMPQYKGGINKLYEYLGKKLKSPRELISCETVVCQFVIEKDGKVSNVRLVEIPELNNEIKKNTIKTIVNMPKWIPGEQNGKTVRVEFMINIKFCGMI